MVHAIINLGNFVSALVSTGAAISFIYTHFPKLNLKRKEKTISTRPARRPENRAVRRPENRGIYMNTSRTTKRK